MASGSYSGSNAWIKKALGIIKEKMESTGLAQYSLLALRPRMSRSQALMEDTAKSLRELSMEIRQLDANWSPSTLPESHAALLQEALDRDVAKASAQSTVASHGADSSHTIRSTSILVKDNPDSMVQSLRKKLNDFETFRSDCIDEGTLIDFPQQSWDFAPAFESFLRSLKRQASTYVRDEAANAESNSGNPTRGEATSNMDRKRRRKA